MDKSKPKGIDKDALLDWASALLPVLLVVIGITCIFIWGNHQSRIKEEQERTRQQELMNAPSSTPTYSVPNNSSSNYVDSNGEDDCTDDCSGHEAGYEYAEENDICDTDYSDGNSDSFNEGVIAWAEENC